jgi:NitT/TauT family transport system permease protein
MPLLRRIRFVYMPPICKTLITVIGTSIGFAFKSGVAAELIGVSAGSIGERLYAAKLYLDAPDVYAWTATIIIVSILSEKIIKGGVYLVYGILNGKYFHKMDRELTMHSSKASNGKKDSSAILEAESAPTATNAPRLNLNTPPASNALEVQNLSISYGTKKIVSNFTHNFTPPKVYALFGKSGSGKTSIIRAILGLIPYSGEVFCENAAKSREVVQKGCKVTYKDAQKMSSLPNASVVFQDDVLEYDLTVWLNLKMVFPKEYKSNTLESEMFSRRLTEGITLFGLENLINEKVSKLSGGQRRRVAILRAFCTNARYIFMDEPFKGLDVGTKEKVMEFVKQELKYGQLLIFATHDTSEAAYFGAEEVYIGYN